MFVGSIPFWIILVSNIVGVMFAASYWAERKYGLFVSKSFYWNIFSQYFVYSGMVVLVWILIIYGIPFVARLDPEMAEALDVLVFPAMLMVAIGHAAAPAYWLQARNVPSSRLVQEADELDEDTETLMNARVFRRKSWDPRNAMPHKMSLDYKEEQQAMADWHQKKNAKPAEVVTESVESKEDIKSTQGSSSSGNIYTK